MPINFKDPALGQRLNEGMDSNGIGQLPFTAPVLYVINGKAELSALKDARYFGGWGVDAGDFEDGLREWGIAKAPESYVLAEMTSSEGKPYNNYITRSVLCAPICYRSAWIDPDHGKRSAEYFVGGRRHAQALVMLAYKNGGIHVMGPAVLSAKGMQVQNLLNSFGAWEKHTRSIRREIAPNVPAWCFYLAVGTFGERKQVVVGKGKATHPITPVGAYLPPELSEKTLESLFVGEEVAGKMARYLEDAKEWREAWKVQQQDQFGQPAIAGDPYGDDFDRMSDNDEIPF